MQMKFIMSAVIAATSTMATAAPLETAYALSAVHADFQAQLEQVADQPGEVGATARTAADLLGQHNAAQERLVLPYLGMADAAADGCIMIGPELSARLHTLEADLSRLLDSEPQVVTALVDLYAVAVDGGQTDVSSLAERMIWHETNDAEVLYPAARLIASIAQGPVTGAGDLHMSGKGD